ncbi:putative autophagy-related protein 22 protein [Neofusicoccum parvum UCRNP2]|uniref:Autophagy-related protein n=2 Tax=Neofusicoccum parvum TaxID=310453 RepID=R1GG87_BOTPV|nr:putative autophagy-related protein 22 protein [Neofusicoccum parvum UCRNP2]GME34125.1 putative autophagy-related protein 22 protein [Neofusicoccum parvum]
MADYGGWAPWIVRVNTVLCFALQVAYLGVHDAGQWDITFWIAYVFFNALFPKVAADQPEALHALEQKENGSITPKDYETRMQLVRSKIINRSWGWNNVGFSSGAALTLGILKGLHASDSVSLNNLGYSVCVAVMAGTSLILSIPWFILEKRRPGASVPAGQNIVSHGLRQVWRNMREAAKLSQTFFYLALYFVLADGVATLQTVVTIAQTRTVAFSAETNSLMLVAQGGSAGVFAFGAHWLQARLALRTKLLLHVSNFACLALALWGVAGVWTARVGFHNLWEIWAFNALYGVSLGTQWSYGQAFMAQLIPRGLENRFFSLLGIVSKGGGWIGPLVSSAVVDRSGNDWSAFGVVAALIGVPAVALFFVDEDKSRIECERYTADEKH